MNSTRSGVDWRATANKVRLGPFDAFVLLPAALLFLVHIRWWTFELSLAVVCVLYGVELFLRMPLEIAARGLRRIVAGRTRSVVPRSKQSADFL